MISDANMVDINAKIRIPNVAYLDTRDMDFSSTLFPFNMGTISSMKIVTVAIVSESPEERVADNPEIRNSSPRTGPNTWDAMNENV